MDGAAWSWRGIAVLSCCHWEDAGGEADGVRRGVILPIDAHRGLWMPLRMWLGIMNQYDSHVSCDARPGM